MTENEKKLKMYCEIASCETHLTGICLAKKIDSPVCCSICNHSLKCRFVCKKIKWANKVKTNKKILIKELEKIVKKSGYKKQFLINLAINEIIRKK